LKYQEYKKVFSKDKRGSLLERDEEGFLERAREVAKIAFSFKDPLLVHHYDADGISSGAIVKKAFLEKGLNIRTKCVKKLDDFEIDKIPQDKEREVIFSDLGGGNTRVNELEDIVIIDHHQTTKIEKIQINPLDFGLDGGEEISAAGVAHLTFGIGGELAIVGAFGDMQIPFRGLNKKIAQNAIERGTLKIERDLKFYGRYSRSITAFLAYSDEPVVPNINYSEEKAREFLFENGIKFQREDGKIKTYSDLEKADKEKLITKLRTMIKEEIMGDCYVFPKMKMDETHEANTFSTLLNACGRHDRAEVGIELCLGSEKACLEARELLIAHKKMLRDGIIYGVKNLNNFDNFYFLDARGVIEEGVVGIVCGMIMKQNWKKPIIGISDAQMNMMKISARSPRKLVEEGLNLGLILREVCQEIGGIGGGHKIAAGASIPKDKLNEFLLKFSEKLASDK
jgi:RecJ-like exonuclease